MAFKESAKAFLDRVLATVPADKQEEVRSLYSKAHEDLSTESTSLEEMTARVKDTARQQTEWWGIQKPKVEEYDRLKLAAVRPEDRPAAAAGLSEEEVQKRVDAVRAETLTTGLGLVNVLNRLSMNHYKEFGSEILDGQKLADEAIKAGLSLEQHYNNTVAERRQKVRDEKYQADMVKAKEEGRLAGVSEVLTRSGQSMPYPVGPTAPTTLAGLQKRPEGQANPFSLEAAVATAAAVAAKQAGT